jgi:thioredoxin:protein disulfide reductase
MRFSRVLALAALGAVAMAILPELMPTGPGASLDAAGMLDSGRFFVAAGLIFLGGLLTSLTPCVYPLIPITVGVFGARQADSRLRAMVLTSAYVVGMGIVFAGLGVFAAASGKAFGNMLGNPWVAAGLAAFMLILASSMFGAFELALPTGLATRLNGVGGAGILGALLMGSVAGFLAAPCTGPVLSGVLTFVATTQNMVLGGGLLFIYAMGIGVPFFLIGVFALRLPKGGEWMEWVKSFFGVALVGLAAMYLRDALPLIRGPLVKVAAALGETGIVGVASALTLIGILAGAIHLSFKEGGPRSAVLKGVGVLLLTLAILVRTTHPPVQGWTTYDAARAQSLAPFDAVIAQAKLEGRPVLIDFFAEWCAACKELDKLTYVAPAVKDETSRFAMLKIDGTTEHDLLTALEQRYGVQGYPTVAFIDSTGALLAAPKVTGFLNAEDFLAELKKVR